MTTNINSEVIMQSETKNWFVALLNRVFHRTKNNPKINPHHTVEQKKIILEGALNSLIPVKDEPRIDVIVQKNKVEQWKHQRLNEETTSNFESTEQGTQPSSLAESKIEVERDLPGELIESVKDNPKLTQELIRTNAILDEYLRR